MSVVWCCVRSANSRRGAIISYDFCYRVYGKLKQAPKAPFKLDGDMHCVGDTSVRRALRETITTCLTSANYRDRRGIVCV